MSDWKAVLLAFRAIDVRTAAGWFRHKRYSFELTEHDVSNAVASFRAFPPLVEELSEGAAQLKADVVMLEEPLTSLTEDDGGTWWPSPTDVDFAMELHARPGCYDSIFVFWPTEDQTSRTVVPCRGWGLGMAPSAWSNDATYAAVGSAASWAWKIPVVGEVWLHEWLLGVCGMFQEDGVTMPMYDADGGGSHGYLQSETTGWTAYYRDLMTGRVREGNESKGITAEAWKRYPTPRKRVLAGLPEDLGARSR
jgi:hypothetical protein